ncbi:hypothetical protein Taro_004971 [Colocasia esculenta]|uniref:Uncharacterized protein n=1 Tax=Colocasia esculenta TaxID=4460 RepID=A0A843TT71_COLES|nr:hypothetical protein [Colocasia esculenta]
MCGVAFTGAGLWSAEPVDGVLALLAVPLLLGCVLVGSPLLVGVCPCWMSPCCWGVCCWLCVWPCMTLHHWALCSAQSMSLLELSRCFVCRVASLVERCDTWLWLLLRCIAWLPCVLVQFPRTVGCFPSEVRSQDCSGLVSASCCATSGLRYAAVVLAVAFWWVLPERRLGGSGGGSPRTSCVASADREVGFVSRALWALPDGGLVSAIGVMLVVLLWKCQSRLVVFPCVWKRLIVRVSFPCLPLVARVVVLARELVPCFCTVATFVVKVPPLVMS